MMYDMVISLAPVSGFLLFLKQRVLNSHHPLQSISASYCITDYIHVAYVLQFDYGFQCASCLFRLYSASKTTELVSCIRCSCH